MKSSFEPTADSNNSTTSKSIDSDSYRPVTAIGTTGSDDLGEILNEVKDDIKRLKNDQVNLSEGYKKLDDNFGDIKKDANDFKKDFVSVFGLFAGLVTFLATEIQVFKSANRFSLIVGESALLAAILLGFSLSLHGLLTENEAGYYKRQKYVFAFIISLLIISGLSFSYAVGSNVLWFKHK
jgi:hypothetical protein